MAKLQSSGLSSNAYLATGAAVLLFSVGAGYMAYRQKKLSTTAAQAGAEDTGAEVAVSGELGLFAKIKNCFRMPKVMPWG
jgi:hypothetical protein